MKKQQLLFSLSGLIWNLCWRNYVDRAILWYTKQQHVSSFLQSVTQEEIIQEEKKDSCMWHLSIFGGRPWLLNSVSNIWSVYWNGSGLRGKQKINVERLRVSYKHFPGKRGALLFLLCKKEKAGQSSNNDNQKGLQSSRRESQSRQESLL